MEETFQNWISRARSYMYLFQMNLNLAKVLTYFMPYSIMNIGWLTFQIGNLWMILRRCLRIWSLILVNDWFVETWNIEYFMMKLLISIQMMTFMPINQILSLEIHPFRSMKYMPFLKAFLGKFWSLDSGIETMVWLQQMLQSGLEGRIYRYVNFRLNIESNQ